MDTLQEEDVQLDWTSDRPKNGGIWPTGLNNGWITATHLPSMQCVRVYYTTSQHKARTRALELLELLLFDDKGHTCYFRENAQPSAKTGKELNNSPPPK